MLNIMALRLIQIKLPDAEYDSIAEIIADQKFVTTWPDHRVPDQLILQLVEPAEACEAISASISPGLQPLRSKACGPAPGGKPKKQGTPQSRQALFYLYCLSCSFYYYF
jgi:hypothetical protein